MICLNVKLQMILPIRPFVNTPIFSPSSSSSSFFFFFFYFSFYSCF